MALALHVYHTCPCCDVGLPFLCRDLRDNNLQWLSGSMFSGIGDQMEDL